MKKKYSRQGVFASIGLSLIFFALYFILQILSIYLVSLLVPNTEYIDQMTIQLSIISSCITVLAFAALYRAAGLSFTKEAYLNKAPGRFYINTIIMGVSTAFAIALVLGLVEMSGIIPDSWVQAQNDTYSDVNAASPLMKFLSVGLMAPIVEEILFRGLILGTLKKNMHPWIAILLSALLFGVAHGTPIGIIYATGLGILMGWLFVKFNSILPVMVFHIAYNCTVAYSEGISLPVAIISIPILVFEIIDIKRYYRGKQK